MSLQKLVVKYPRATRAIFAFGIPLVVCMFWLTVGASIAYGQEAPGSPVASASEWGTVPVVGTSLTAAGAFYWLIGFLNKTIERNDKREEDIHERYGIQIKNLQEAHALELRDAHATAKYWSGLYHEVTKESVTESRRLAHIHHSSNRPST
jgi:hypothetical protein